MKNYKIIIIFFGPPGSGKGTQAKIINKKINLPIISPGNLFRHEQSEKTRIGIRIAGYIKNGELVPDSIVNEIIDKRLLVNDTKEGFIFDGYPRRKSQLKMLSKQLKKVAGNSDKIIAVYINTGDKKVIERVSGRRVCECGASYHIKTDPPKIEGVCDSCGLKLHQREDDAPEIVKNRLKNFHKRIKPLINYFRDNYFLITVDGDKSINEVEKEVWQKLKKI